MKTILEQLEQIEKQPQQSGVELIDYYPLKFSEHYWNNDNTVYSEKLINKETIKNWEYSSDEMISLVDMVVKVDDLDCYFLKNKYGKAWEEFKTKAGLHDKLFNDYQKFNYKSMQDPHKIYTNDRNKISALVYGKGIRVIDNEEVEVLIGTIPSVYTTVDYPMHPEYLCADTGHFVLNLGATYETIKGMTDFEKGSKILRMIYHNLCNYPVMKHEDGTEYTDEEERFALYYKVLKGQYLEEDKDFKFVVHWCAAIVQNPGINLMTNIWFAGEYQGIGKGTLVNLMRKILGRNRVDKCKPALITGNFNAVLDGKFILEINEKQQGISPAEMTNWLKGFSQEEDIQIEKKGQDPFTRINTVNIIGTAQTPEDVFMIEDEDRRNVIFRTVEKDSDPSKIWKLYAMDIAKNLKSDQTWAQAFAWILERVEVDTQLLSTAYQTRGYNDVKVTQMEMNNPLYLWAQEAFVSFAKTGAKMLASELKEKYELDNPKRAMTQGNFNKRLHELKGVSGLPVFTLPKTNNLLRIHFEYYNETPGYRRPDILED